MRPNGSPRDLNDIALANLRESIPVDDTLLPEWKRTLGTILKDKIPRDLSALEKLVAVEQADDSIKET
jgi:hypothetical protein